MSFFSSGQAKYLLLIVCALTLMVCCFLIAFHSMRRRGAARWPRHLNALLGVCAVAMLLGGALLWSRTPVAAHAAATATPMCQGQAIHSLNDSLSGYCDGQSPVSSGCWNSHAYVVGGALWTDQNGKALGTLRLWYSSTCGTNWAQLVVGRDTRHADRFSSWYPADGSNGLVLGVTCASLTNPSSVNIAIELTSDFNANPGKMRISPYALVNNNGSCTEITPMVYAPSYPVVAVAGYSGNYGTVINQADTPQQVEGTVIAGDWWYTSTL